MILMADIQSTELLRLLSVRLERLPVDSHWSHSSSGLRRDMFRLHKEIDFGQQPEPIHLDLLIGHAFEILHKATRVLLPDLQIKI